jgi:uncharacterized protein (TIGR00369 family)
MSTLLETFGLEWNFYGFSQREDRGKMFFMERLPGYGRCFMCGRVNPRGLRLELFVDGDLVITEFKLEDFLIGYEGIVHGGVQAGILDEVMWWASSWGSQRATYTADMTIRYKKPALIDHRFRAIGKVTGMDHRFVYTEGEIVDLEDQKVCTTASARYYILSEEKSRELFRLLDYSNCSEEVKKRYLKSENSD